jgi:hypothetical protein
LAVSVRIIEVLKLFIEKNYGWYYLYHEEFKKGLKNGYE